MNIIEQIKSSFVSLPVGDQEQFLAFAQQSLQQHYTRLEQQHVLQQAELANTRLDRYVSG